MPQLSDRFSAYPVTVRLDGSGNGTIRFQAQGANIVITNLYVAVATSTLQAKCTIYKTQVASGNAIDTTNSGSTGAKAGGKIELLDGEAVFVAWTGGDANTIATATFTGYKIPFNTSPTDGGTDFLFTDPFAAGDGTIIFPALKSPNYVPGVSGWKIDRDGTVEFGDGTFRGELEVIGTSSGKKIIISPNEPFQGIEFDSGNVNLFANGFINVFNSGLQISSPDTNGFGLVPFITIAQQSGGSTQGLIEIDECDVNIKSTSGLFDPTLNVDKITVNNTIQNTSDSLFYLRGETGSFGFNLVAASSATQTINFTNTFPSVPSISTNITSGSGTTARWYSRAINPTTTSFQLFVAKGDAADPALTINPLTVQWIAAV